MKRDSALLIIRMLFILLFIYASFSKIFDPEGFKDSMEKQPFPQWIRYALMFLVPASEIAISVLLFKEKFWRLGIYLSTALMTAFTLYIGIVLLHFFRYVPCSCGGVIKQLSWQQHLIFNLFFVLLGIVGIILPSSTDNKRGYNPTQLSV
ncbi:DoxX family protein [Chitinophaga sp. CC14]|uniref:MauE/DoxX family redox-associated membrane protein n=1 Tax=Chitinophaga sp. CC14 TaxID=3029199 RepID=UPI003B76FDB3